MKYRPEIDGLRAFAVLPVILYHANIPGFSGGFIGVDVFFVISGFLISALLLNDLSSNNFSIRRFYARRARRILPALFTVLLATIPVTTYVLLPAQLQDYSGSLIAVTGFVSNIFFWSRSGYFAPESSEMPLLHTWSLSVEEQFYILFPVVLLLLYRYCHRHIGLVLGALVIAGLILCDVTSRTMPNANFYLLPTRAWELLIGSFCAYYTSHTPQLRNPWLSLAGLGLICISVFEFNDHMRLPSLLSLLPVVGTALVLLYTSPPTFTARFLSLPLFLRVGKISYSAYLWHYPLFALARVASPSSPSIPLMILLTIFTLALGAVSWRYIEQPFRQRTHPNYVGNRTALTLAIFSASLILGAGIYGYMTQGRLAHWQRHAANDKIIAYQLLEEARKAEHFYDNSDCKFNVTDLAPEKQKRIISCFHKYGRGIALIGDSHAINLFGALHPRIKQPFVVGISQGMCRPHSANPTCYYDQLLQMLNDNPKLFSHIIYEQAGWHLLAHAPDHEIRERDLNGLPLDARVPDYIPNETYILAVKDYLSKLSVYGKVIWLGPHIEPQIRENVAVTLGCNHKFTLRPNLAEQFVQLDHTIERLLAGSPVRYHSQIEDIQLTLPQDYMNCNEVYFSDTNHFSPAGERRFGERIDLNALLH